MYQKLFLDNNYTNQFVCATQPLSLLLSKDSFLCFDGDNFGLYYPWRDYDSGSLSNMEQIDTDLKRYLDSKGAFSVPPINEQRRILKLFMDNLYPLYPVVERNLIENIKEVPLLLLNAILLASVRFDTLLCKEMTRLRANELFERCKLLELTEKNKITLIQSYILISYHEEGMDGSNSSKEYICKACNLCSELAMTNMGGKNGILNNQSVDVENAAFKKIPYNRRFLLRLFWTSFCCDRLISATSGREMIYNTSDMMVDSPSLNDFDEGEHQLSDFETFTAFLSICKLIERVQCNCYRPPKNRTIDDWSLEKDLLQWNNDLSKCQPKLRGFLKILYAYSCILYFRCFIDTISIITKEFGVEDDNESKTKSLEYIDKYSKTIVDNIESNSYVHHIVVVHSILHTIALVQVQMKTTVLLSNINTNLNELADRSISIINYFRYYWWLAGSALYLCKEVMPDNFKSIDM